MELVGTVFNIAINSWFNITYKVELKSFYVLFESRMVSLYILFFELNINEAKTWKIILSFAVISLYFFPGTKNKNCAQNAPKTTH